ERHGDYRQWRRGIRGARLRDGVRRGNGQATLADLYGAGRSVEAFREQGDESCGEDMEGRLVQAGRRRIAVGRVCVRSEDGPALFGDGERRAVGIEIPQPGWRQFVFVFGDRAEAGDGEVRV